MEQKLVVGSHNSFLAQEAARALGCDFIAFSNTRFSDTESNITLEQPNTVMGKSVFLFFQCYSQYAHDAYVPQPLNDQIFDLLLVTQMLKQLKAARISLVLPYLPYARQEKNTNDQPICVATLFGYLLKQAGVDELIVADMHTERLLQVMPLPLHNVPLTNIWKSVYDGLEQEFDPENICLVSPDAGGCQRVQALVEITGYASAFIKKTRDGDGRPRALDLVGDVSGKTVILIDDIVDTAQTAMSACELLLERGAVKVIGCFSHAVLSLQAYENLKNSRFERIFLSDTLLFDSSIFDKKYTVISMHDLVIQHLKDMSKETNI